jgi:hypothetical protein
MHAMLRYLAMDLHDRRREELNRLVELEALEAPPARLADAVTIRRGRLASGRHRRRLARAVRRALDPGVVPASFASPGASQLRRDPELAERVAQRLEADSDDVLLAIAVERLLTTAGNAERAMRPVRELTAC